MSYTGYKSSPRGGGGYRGRGGGGYRGSRGNSGEGGGGWRGSGGRGYSGGRGSSSRYSGGSSGGGGKWERENSGYTSTSRYNSGGGSGGGGGERYSSHGREESSSFRYRNDDSISSFTSRDHSHRASSPERKRIRSDYSPASSLHRSSHDFSEGNDYSSRSYGNYESKRMSGGSFGGGGEDRRTTIFREERERIRSDDYEFRKPMSAAPRHSSTRGTSYRGRVFTRGRSGFRRPNSSSYRGSFDGGFIRKRTLMDRSYGVRKRLTTIKPQDYLRRLKMLKIQRLRKMREAANKDSDVEDEDEEEEEIEEEIEEEVTDEDQEEMETNEKEEEAKKKEEDDEDVEGGEEKKDEEKKIKKVKKVIKVVKKVKKIIKSESGKDDDGDNKDIQVTVKQDGEGRDVDGPVRKNYLGIPFMKLECPHCHFTCETFKEYIPHLRRGAHQQAMLEASLKVRETLGRVRAEQREEQKELDEECKDMKMRTLYCQLCKLNFRSLKSEHAMSDKHRELKKLINPFCKVCRMTLKSPMMYENHICSLDHLKRKHYTERKNAEKAEGNAEIDMDNYMVLDQVGSGEEDSDSESGKEDKEKAEGEEGETTADGEKVAKEKKPKKKKVVNLGSEYCKKMEIYFCDLCKTFLPRIDDQEQALAIHCRGRSHLRWYVKKRDDLALRKRAEQIHRLRQEQRKALAKEQGKSESAEGDGTPVKSKDSKKGEEMETEDGIDEKTWSEIDKSLGSIIRDEEPENTDDDEDSQTGGRRYDRFKHSEKTKAGSTDEKEAKAKSAEEKVSKAEIVNGGDNKDDNE